MKLKLIIEAIEHDTALKLISSLIKKSSKWRGKVFLAGGAVRDQLMGLDTKDLDLTVAAPNGGIEFAIWLCKELKIYRSGSNPVVFPRFGTAKLTLKGIIHNGIDLSKVDVECVMTRAEQYTLGSRKPDVRYGTPQEDVERRDLTINSLLKDLTTDEIKDFTGMGLADLNKKYIRTPLDPDVTFREDPLRMLRAIRFTVKYNWTLPLNMIRALKNNASMLKTISVERIQDELNKILLSNNPDKGIRLLQLTGLNKYVAPELDKLIKMKQNKFHQWDAMKHTLEVLKKTPPNIVSRLGALLHDIGKAEVRDVINNEVHFYAHEKVGAEIARDILKRLKYPNNIIDAVYKGVLYHMKTKYGEDSGDKISDKALRKLQQELGDHLETTLDIIHADNISHGLTYNMPNQVPNIKKRLSTFKSQENAKLTLPINGNDIIKKFNLKPGKLVGDILDAIRDKVLEKPTLSKIEAYNIAKKIINKGI